jgi:hypothetical protein
MTELTRNIRMSTYTVVIYALQSGYPLTLYKKSDTSCSSAPRNVNHFLSRIDSRTRSFKALKSSTSLSQAP